MTRLDATTAPNRPAILVFQSTVSIRRIPYSVSMRRAAWIILGSLLVAACSPTLPAQSTRATPDAGTATAGSGTDLPVIRATDWAPAGRTNRRVEDFQASLPPQLIPRDGIRPVYDPEFQPASQAPLVDEELVIGVAVDGEAKAYPISVLRFREMVNDRLAGIPTLVTW